MTELQLAYLAGLIDGEGYVGMSRLRGGRAHNSRISIEMTNEAVVTAVRQMVGYGDVQKRPPTGLGRRHRWAWRVSTRQAEQLAALILPYSVLKAPQLSLLGAFVELRGEPRKGHSKTPGKRGWTKPDEYLAREQALAAACRLFNRRGTVE